MSTRSASCPASERGAMSAFAFDLASGQMQFLNRVSSGGDGPCHLSLPPDGKYSERAHRANSSHVTLGTVSLIGMRDWHNAPPGLSGERRIKRHGRPIGLWVEAHPHDAQGGTYCSHTTRDRQKRYRLPHRNASSAVASSLNTRIQSSQFVQQSLMFLCGGFPMSSSPVMKKGECE